MTTCKLLSASMLALGMVLAWGHGPAYAQASPCADDVQKFCKDVAAGGGARYQCLKRHEKDLSEACKKHVADMGQKVRGVRAACWDDIERVCGEVQPGRGRIYQCLREHESELSEPCKAALPPPRKP